MAACLGGLEAATSHGYGFGKGRGNLAAAGVGSGTPPWRTVQAQQTGLCEWAGRADVHVHKDWVTVTGARRRGLVSLKGVAHRDWESQKDTLRTRRRDTCVCRRTVPNIS